MLAIVFINSVIVAVTVIIHYEFLFRMTRVMPRMKIRHRFRTVFGVCGALVAHAVEVWVFGFAYYFMHGAREWGRLEGHFDGSLMDCVYFSFTTFTTLGFGDIHPTGELRYLTGIESLTGLVLITWTASFLFIEMKRYWGAN
ncbi:potassium channel family protein [Zobellella maritima]|uniref:potassium channel family protein n=1 Tax=Zobellella maritima TaxID=2059725 RepID=UPI000E303D10|nr:potassium channel family protein [Zobellella maritima]